MSVASREERFLASAPELPSDTCGFVNHYLALAGDAPVPKLEAFFDRPPYEHMPRVVVADILDGQNFVVRYFGTAIVDIVGKDHTGTTSEETRPRGLDGRYATVSWLAVNFPCGYLSQRLIYRQSAPGAIEAAFELLTVALPARRESGVHCLIQYHSSPHLAASHQLDKRDSVALKVIPLCWLDTGNGTPEVPIQKAGMR